MTASRRILALTLSIGLLAAPLAIGAQSADKMPRIAVVFGVLPVTAMVGAKPSDRDLRAFLQGLRTLGYVEGQNIVIERRSAAGRFERFPEIFAELVQDRTLPPGAGMPHSCHTTKQRR